MEQAAALWELFIKTGSPDAYLAYKAEADRQMENKRETGGNRCT